MSSLADPTNLEVFSSILRSLALIILFIVVGFGPGFILGIIIANRVFGRGQPNYMQSYKQAVKDAAEHNRQWHPDHERWKT